MIEKTSASFEEFQKEVIEEVKAKAEKDGDKQMMKVAEEMEKDLGEAK